MPHFIIECSENVLTKASPDEIIQAVYETAIATELFAASGADGVKVRIQTYRHFTTVDSGDDFIHVFAHIMEGRTTAQKKQLTHQVVGALKSIFPSVPVISMDVSEFDKETYCNRTMV